MVFSSFSIFLGKKHGAVRLVVDNEDLGGDGIVAGNNYFVGIGRLRLRVGDVLADHARRDRGRRQQPQPEGQRHPRRGRGRADAFLHENWIAEQSFRLLDRKPFIYHIVWGIHTNPPQLFDDQPHAAAAGLKKRPVVR